MIVAKFGGTSVATAPRIETLCKIVQKEQEKNPIVVVSALSGITDLLLALASIPSQRKANLQEIKRRHYDMVKNLWKNGPTQVKVLAYIDKQLTNVTKLTKKKVHSKASLDKLASFGEIMSSYIVSNALNKAKIKAKQVLATDLIITNNNFGSAEFIPEPTSIRIKKVLRPLIAKGIVPVVTGFIGSTKDGKVTTLGRGGSDYTAAIIGFCLNADEIQIWTDVDGIFTADPRLVPNAKLIESISFKEASELATFGARVLHPRTIKPAIKAGIPVKVLNSFNPESKGTFIVEKSKTAKPVRAVCAKRNITLVNIYSEEMLLQKGFLARVFSIFTKHGISIDLVSVSEVNVSVTLDNNNMLDEVIEELKTFSIVTVKKNMGIVSVIGEGIVQSSKTAKEIFAALYRKTIPVRMVSLGATDINISLVVDNDMVEKAVKILHSIIVGKGV